MALKNNIWSVLFLVVLCAGSVSCRPLSDILVKPFESSTSSEKRSAQKKQAKGCHPVRDKDIVYVVRKGDTLGEIAQCFRARWYDIAKRNKIKNPNAIRIGQKLVIPARSSKTTASRAKAGGKATSKPARAPSRAKSGIVWAWPAKGKIIRKFSPKGSGKQGISIAGKTGQKVVSAASGKVVYSGEGLVGYGRLVIVQHKKDFLTAYAHNHRLLVKEGQQVKKGQTIAHMGKTAAKTPRLHFEIRYKGNAVDPLKYLP